MASSIRKTVLKRVDDAIWTSFAEAYQKAHDYYDNDQLDECIKECSDILGEGAVPRYIKISTLILLALVVESEADFRAARSEAESLYRMTISFHRTGKDAETDEAFDALRASLDELKETEEKEFGVSMEEMDEKDDAVFVEMQSRAEDNAAIRELEEGEEADTEALRKADEMAMDPEQYPAERNQKVQMSEAASAPFKPVLLAQQEAPRRPEKPLHLRAKRTGNYQEEWK